MTVQFNPTTESRGIDWTDETRNAMGGCVHDCKWKMPDGTITGCYAKDLAENGVAKRAYPEGFEHHYWRPDALRQLGAGADPLLIFVDSMSDLFAADVPAKHVGAVLDAMGSAPRHSYQSLTKAAPGMLKYLDRLPPNLWVGVSSPPDFFRGHELSHRQQVAMLKKSMEVVAEVKRKTGNIVWMSAEPVSWDFAEHIGSDHALDWIVIGAASHRKRYYQPEPENVRRLLELMDHTQTPVFYKGNIKPLFDSHNFETLELNRWREDFPVAYRDGRPIPAVMARQRACLLYGWTRSRGITVPPGPRQLRLPQVAG